VVTAGQVLLSVEAMKMEHQLVAPSDGTVHLSASPGDLVKADQVLATVHPAAPSAVDDSTAGDTDAADDAVAESVIAMGASD
jgi:acetyl-CoA/propionyl-CoA carboxylase biotin carboxyl carrier protein